jgi:hypothetical protein
VRTCHVLLGSRGDLDCGVVVVVVVVAVGRGEAEPVDVDSGFVQSCLRHGGTAAGS